MEPVYSRAQLEALRVPVLELLTLHLDDETYPLVRVDSRQRPDVADLARVHRATGSLMFTTWWIGELPCIPGAVCWLVVEVAQPAVAFALAFPNPSALAGVAQRRTLTLLLDNVPDPAASASALYASRLRALLENSVTLTLDAAGCTRLAQYLVGWPASPAEGKGQRWPAN